MQTLDSEKTIIGSILYHEGFIRQIQQHITPEDMFHSENRLIYDAMINLDDNGITVNLLTLYSELEKRKGNPIERQYLEDAVQGYAVEIADALSIAKQLAAFSAQRMLESKVEAVNKVIHARELNVQDYLGMLEAVVADISKKSTQRTVMSGKALTSSFLDFLGKKKSDGVFSGIYNIDKTVYNFFAGEFIVVAARPGVGKTTMLIQSAIENLKKGKKVGFITMEMTPAQLLLRMIAYRSGVNSTLIAKLDPIRLQEDEAYMLQHAAVLEAMSYFEQAPLFIETAAPYNISTVLATMRNLKYVHDVDALYLDYIQLIEADRPGANRAADLSTITRKLKNIAGELAVPLMSAAQLNREVERRVGMRPVLADLKESGSIEQDASLVFFIYPDTTNMENLQSDALLAKLKTMDVVNVFGEIAKARSGPLGLFSLKFDKRVSKFTERDGVGGYTPPSAEEVPLDSYDSPNDDSDIWD